MEWVVLKGEEETLRRLWEEEIGPGIEWEEGLERSTVPSTEPLRLWVVYEKDPVSLSLVKRSIVANVSEGDEEETP
jgi:hypothetical protein